MYLWVGLYNVKNGKRNMCRTVLFIIGLIVFAGNVRAQKSETLNLGGASVVPEQTASDVEKLKEKVQYLPGLNGR